MSVWSATRPPRKRVTRLRRTPVDRNFVHCVEVGLYTSLGLHLTIVSVSVVCPRPVAGLKLSSETVSPEKPGLLTLPTKSLSALKVSYALAPSIRISERVRSTVVGLAKKFCEDP